MYLTIYCSSLSEWHLWQGDEWGQIPVDEQKVEGFPKQFGTLEELILFAKTLPGEVRFNDMVHEAVITLIDGRVHHVTRSFGWNSSQVKSTWERVV